MHLVALTVLFGYFVAGRGFAYLGVPGLYPAEAFLLASTLRVRKSWLPSYLDALCRFKAIAVFSTLFLAWGCYEGLVGYLDDRPVADVLLGLPMHYYPLLWFVGVHLGKRMDSEKLSRFWCQVAVWTGISGAAYVLLGPKLSIFLPWAPEIPVLTGPAIAAFPAVAAIALLERPKFKNFVALLLPLVGIAMGGRAAFIGALLGIAVVHARRKRVKNGLRLAVAALILLNLLPLVQIVVPDRQTRVGDLSPLWIAARVVSVVDGETAYNLLAQNRPEGALESIQVDAGTAEWRRRFWRATLASLDSAQLWITGHGYGFSLGSLAGYGEQVRTPHNCLIYLVGYTGLIGLALYLCFFLSLLQMFMRLPRSRYRDMLLGVISSVVVMSLSGNLLETPFGAVPFYLGCGLSYSVANRARRLACLSQPTSNQYYFPTSTAALSYQPLSHTA